MFRTISLLTLACLGASATPTLTGEWRGTLQVPGGGLRLVLHVTGSAGAFKARLESPDQGAKDIPVSSISLDGNTVRFASEAVHGTFEGTLSGDGNAIEGTWSQNGGNLPLSLKRAAASDIAGAWSGTLDVQGRKLRLVFHIAGTADGLTATMDSPDQGAIGIAMSKVTRRGEAITMDCDSIGGKFEGKISADHSAIDGSWSQNGARFSLLLKKTPDIVAPPPKRPQNPRKPYPYKEDEVKFPGGAAGVTLAGTLTIPRGKGPFRAVVLVCGSGPHDRNESLMGHEPFWVLSDYLTRHGIEVLRYDKRGVAASSGEYEKATTADFAADAEAAVEFLRKRPEVDRRKIGIVGHSEGGVIAPMVAAEDAGVAFIVMMAGSGVPGDQILPEQNRLISEASGVPPETARMVAAREAKIIGIVEKAKDAAAAKERAEKEFGKQGADMAGTLSTPWMRYFLTYDPATALRKVKCPVLALNGSKDLQVPPAQNLPAIRKALAEAGNKRVEIDELPGLNHLFQPARTGNVIEYEKIEITIAPEVLEKIADWILRQ